MNRMIISNDGDVFMDVTDIAYKVRSTNLFEMYEVWEKDNDVYKYPINLQKDFQRAIDTNHAICIYIGSFKDKRMIITNSSWEEADKIVHNGFIYVKFSDLRYI